MSAKAVALTGAGELNLKTVRVRVRRDGSEVLAVPAAKVRFSWREIRGNFIREIVVENPRFKVTDALLSALPATGGARGDTVPWRIGRLAVTGGRGQVDLAAWPQARFGFRVELTEGEGRNEMEITGLRVRTQPDGAEALALASVKVRASLEDLRGQRIREVLVTAPRVVVTDRLLAMFPTKTSASSPTRVWTVDRLRLADGQATVDLAAWPRADFAFAAELRERQPIGGTPGEMTLSAVRVHVRESGGEALSIPRVQAKVTLEGLKAKKIREVTIESPQIAVSDALLAVFSSAKSTAPPPVTEAEESPWKVERLALKGGRVGVDLAGAPLVQFGLDAQLGDDLLPPRERGEMQAAVSFTDLAVRARGAVLEPFLRVPAVRTKFRLPEVQREHRVAWAQVDGFDFRFNKVFRELIASGEKPAIPAAPPTASTKSARSFSFGELVVTDGNIHLDDLGLGLPSIGCRVNTSFRNLALAPDAGVGGQELQTIELSRIALTSPLDPFVEVLSLETVFIRFTLAGIWRREIEEVAIVRPRLDIGPDLFWYVDRVQKNESAPSAPVTAAADAEPDWQIHRFSATAGQLFLALEGHSEVALPMPFESHAENLNFRKLSDLRLKLRIDMPVQDYDYPGYELTLRGVGGRVEFSLPPAAGANNVVNTLRLREVRWKQFRLTDSFLDVTYDERGIYGNLGGKGYSGVLRGQFNFLLGDGSPWNGWVSGTRVDLKPVTDALAPDKFSLTGPADFRLTVAARASSIDQVVGDFTATKPGELRIGKIDELIKELPGDWTGLKRGLSRISLEALRDFAYDTAHGDFRFHGREGALHLDLRGPNGGRKVEVEFHDGPKRRKGGRIAAQ